MYRGRVVRRTAILAIALAALLLPGSAAARGLGAVETRVVAVGDIVCDPDEPAPPGGCGDRATFRVMARAKPGLVLALGDLQYGAGRLNDFESAYALTWGRVRDRTLPTPGNHEYMTPDAAGYYAWWGERAGPGFRGWYSRRVGSWLILSLNSNCEEAGGCGRDSPQGRWLRRTLRASDAECQVAFWHHPRFSSGAHGDSADVAPLWELLQEARAELVLAGHDHGYERFRPMLADGTASASGIRSFVVGTGGIDLRDFAGVRAGSLDQVKAHGVAVLELRPRGWTQEFRSVGGATTRSVGARCR